MTATEQDAFLQWLREQPSHRAAFARLDKTWGALDQLSKWRPVHSPRPNPDLLAPARPSRWRRYAGLMAFAAAVAFAFLWRFPSGSTVPQHQAIIHPGPERLVLEDGSIIELNAGAKVDVRFTAAERRVQLLQGEGHFTVAKNPARPFIVSADKFSVRAVGTAFAVSLDREVVSVLVTEGKVRLEETSARVGEPDAAARELSQLVAGQQAMISVGEEPAVNPGAESPPALQVRDVTPAEIERALSWQGMRLEFINMPLKDVVAEFNRYNVRKLVVDDAETAHILVGGNFRADNVDAFVRLLENVFGVTAIPRGNEVGLRRAR
jgi:transmembrane sensor